MKSQLKSAIKRALVHAIFASAITTAASMLISNNYTSESSLIPASKSNQITNNLAIAAAELTGSVSGQDDELVMYENILRSRWMAEQILTNQYSFDQRWGYWGKPVRHQETLLDYLGLKNIDQGVGALRGLMKVKRDPKLSIITITSTTHSPDLSAAIVKKTTESLSFYLKNKNISDKAVKAEFANQRLESKRNELLTAESNLRNFIEKNHNYNTSNDPSIRLQGARLEAELSFARSLVVNAGQAYEVSLLDARSQLQEINILDKGYTPTEKSGPKRSLFVFATFLLVSTISWTYQNRRWLAAKLMGVN